MVYEINQTKLREGIEEMLKWRVNEILNNRGPFTLASAILNYQSTRQLAIRCGVDVSQYNFQVNQVRETVGRMC